MMMNSQQEMAVNISKHSYLATMTTEAGAGGEEILAASPSVQQAVSIVWSPARYNRCTVAVYDVPAGFIDPDTMDPLFKFDYENSADDNKPSLERQLQIARDAYELCELRMFKLETLRSWVPDDETLEEISNLESLLDQNGN
jgi:hypothetical protein